MKPKALTKHGLTPLLAHEKAHPTEGRAGNSRRVAGGAFAVAGLLCRGDAQAQELLGAVQGHAEAVHGVMPKGSGCVL